MQCHSLVKSLLVGLTAVLTLSTAQAAVWSQGDLFSTSSDFYTNDEIRHYNAAGTYLDSIVLPFDYYREVKGLAFGGDGLLYAVQGRSSDGFAVLAFDQNGVAQKSWNHSTYVAGNLSYGKLAFGNDGSFYVTGQNELVKFTPGQSSGTVIYNANQVFDVEALPNGNLLVLSAYGLAEITPDGQAAHTVAAPGTWLVDARGVEYDPLHNDIFVTMLGYSDNFFQLMRFDGATGQIEKSTDFWYGDDMVLTHDGRLVVGSRTQAPGIFDRDLNRVGTIGSSDQMFVAEYVAEVPEPASAALVLGGLGLMAMARRRRSLAR